MQSAHISGLDLAEDENITITSNDIGAMLFSVRDSRKEVRTREIKETSLLSGTNFRVSELFTYLNNKTVSRAPK